MQAWGRFISRDPIQDGYNWYAYCNNDPVNDDDPEGLQDDLVTEAAGAAFLAWLLWWMWYQQHNNTPPIVWPSLPRNPPSEARRPRNGRRVTEGHGDDKPGHTPQSGDQAKGQQGFPPKNRAVAVMSAQGDSLPHNHQRGNQALPMKISTTSLLRSQGIGKILTGNLS